MKDLSRFNSRRKADQLVMVLRDHGIEAAIDSLNEHLEPYSSMISEVVVRVSDEQYELACEVLASLEDSSPFEPTGQDPSGQPSPDAITAYPIFTVGALWALFLLSMFVLSQFMEDSLAGLIHFMVILILSLVVTSGLHRVFVKILGSASRP